MSKAQDRPTEAAPDTKPTDSKPPSDSKPTDQPGAAPAAPAPTAPAPTPPAPAQPSSARRIRELEEKVERLTRAVAEMKSAPPPAPVPTTPAPAAATSLPEPNHDLDPLRGIVVSGYVQAQLENHDESEDQIRPGGAPLNQNRFLIRRGRVRVEREWENSAVMMEIDGNTTKGPAIQLFKAEASIFWRANNPAPTPPVIKVALGLFDTPFGYEMLESPRTRFFMERSLQSRAFFPTEPDLGIRLGGSLAWFRYAIAFMNGEPLGEPGGFAGQDPNNHKDFIAHLGASAAPVKDSEISGGVSVINGKGFVKGTDATKNQIAWNDSNGNQILDQGDVVGIPGSGASPSYSFDRWAIGADLQVRFKTDLGQSKLYGELQLGSNMDRALFIASPTTTGQPSRELGYYLGLVQEITPYAVVGFRTDYYNPDADFLGYVSGKIVPISETVRTYSPVVGLVVPGHARLVFQYDFVKDHMGRTAQGLTTDLKNDQWTLRLQGEL